MRDGRRALDGVAELAYVAGPREALEPAQVLRQHLQRTAARELSKEMLHEQRDVALPFAQRRHMNPKHGDSVVEILAKAAG